MFDEELDRIKTDNAELWRPELEIEWCNAKLHLYALTFTLPLNTDSSLRTMQIKVHRQSVLHKARKTASMLTTELTRLGRQCISDSYPSGLLTFVPKTWFTALFNAAAFLFRSMATCNTLTSVSIVQSSAMVSMIEAHKIFQSFPGQRELTRAAIHIEMFIEVLRNSSEASNMEELVVNNKLSASVMFDAVFRACRARNIDPRSGKPLPVRNWKTVNETFAQRLPDVVRSSTLDEDGKNNAEPGNRNNDFDTEFPQWWKDWDDYMDLFQVGAEQWEGMDMTSTIPNGGELGDPQDFM